VGFAAGTDIPSRLASEYILSHLIGNARARLYYTIL